MIKLLPTFKKKAFLTAILGFAVVLSSFGQAPEITSHVSGSSLEGTENVTFTWSTGSATNFDFTAGIGNADDTSLNGYSQTTNTSETVFSLPMDGSTIYVQLWYFDANVTPNWNRIDYTFTAASASANESRMISPEPLNDFTDSLDGASVTFTWNTGDSTQNDIIIGTTGPGSSDIQASSPFTGTSFNATGLPSDGNTFNVRLGSNLNGTQWVYNDYIYRAYGDKATMLTPTEGSTIMNNTPTFTWNAGSASEYDILIGSDIGFDDFYNASTIASSETSHTVLNTSTIPTDGTTKIHVRLWTKLASSGAWIANDYVYNDPTILSVDEFNTDGAQANNIQAYPNPSNGGAVTFRVGGEARSLSIYNALGQEVSRIENGERSSNSTTFSLDSNLSTGIYTAVSNDGASRARFVVSQ